MLLTITEIVPKKKKVVSLFYLEIDGSTEQMEGSDRRRTCRSLSPKSPSPLFPTNPSRTLTYPPSTVTCATITGLVSTRHR